MTLTLSVVVSALGIAGVVAQGARRWWGWALAVASEVLFALLVIVKADELAGVLVLSAVFAVLYVRNAWQWRKEAP